MANVGVSIVQGIWNGIQSMGGWLGTQVSNFFHGLIDGAKKAITSSSPSKLWGDEIGVPMAQGVGIGFLGVMPTVQSQIISTIKPSSFIGSSLGRSSSQSSSVNSNTDTPILEDIRDAL